MKTQKNHSYRCEPSSLLSLKMVLTTARKALPPRISKKDASDELALRFIEKIRTDYKVRVPSLSKAAERATAGVVDYLEER
jgi:hypothetical protein